MSAAEILWQTLAAICAIGLALCLVWCGALLLLAVGEWWNGGDEFDRQVRDEQVRRALLNQGTKR